MRFYDFFKQPNVSPHYSNVSALITYSFSLYGVFSLLLSRSIVWVPSGISVISASLILFSSSSDDIRSRVLKQFNKNFLLFTRIFLTIFYLLSSIVGLFSIVNILPLNDLSSAAFPMIFLSFIFCGSSLGLFHRLSTQKF